VIIIPAIDLIDGKCVRLYKGDYSKKKIYDDSPANRAKIWEDGGAQIIHLVDLEGAKDGLQGNFEAIKSIREIVKCKLEIGGGIRSFEDAEKYLQIGIDRVIIGTAALKNPSLVDALSNMYPNQIIVGADAKNDKVSIDGWQNEGELDIYEFAASFNHLNLAGIVFTDIATDGTLQGPNIPAQIKMGKIIKNPLIASGGISSLEDIKKLAEASIKNIEGVIVGTALYEEKFTLSEAIAEAANVG